MPSEICESGADGSIFSPVARWSHRGASDAIGGFCPRFASAFKAHVASHVDGLDILPGGTTNVSSASVASALGQMTMTLRGAVARAILTVCV